MKRTLKRELLEGSAGDQSLGAGLFTAGLRRAFVRVGNPRVLRRTTGLWVLNLRLCQHGFGSQDKTSRKVVWFATCYSLVGILWTGLRNFVTCFSVSFHVVQLGLEYKVLLVAACYIVGVALDARSGCWRNGLHRPVLKHGPRSLTYTRVFGWKTRARNESKGSLVLLR
jgi:hypothetical protein